VTLARLNAGHTERMRPKLITIKLAKHRPRLTNDMTQSEFAKWLERVLGDTPIEELVAPEILEHVNRLHLEGEERAWRFAKEDARDMFEMTIRALCKTMFAVGYDAGREQAQIDAWFSGGSQSDDDDQPKPPAGSGGGLVPLL